MRGLAAVTKFDHVLQPSAGRGRLIAKLPRQQQITAIEIDPTKAAHLAMMPHCREGGAEIIWAIAENGQRIPLDAHAERRFVFLMG
jgi:hypothetical protein